MKIGPFLSAACALFLFASCGGEPEGKAQRGPDPKEVEDLRAEIERLKARLRQIESSKDLTKRPLPADIADETLIKLLHCGDLEVMRAAATAAHKRPSPRVMQALMALARNPYREINQRNIGFDALAPLQTPEVLEMWKELLADPQEHVVYRAANALGATRDPAHLPVLLETLEAQTFVPTPARASSARQGLITALGQLGDRRATPHLIKELQSPNENHVHSALNALRTLRDEAAFPALLAFFQRLNPKQFVPNNYTERLAVEALAETRDRRAGPALVSWLGTPQEELLAGKLAGVCGPDTIPALQEKLDAALRGAAMNDARATKMAAEIVRALGAMADDRAGRVLLSLAEYGPQGQVAAEIALALPLACSPAMTGELLALHNKTRSQPLKNTLDGMFRSGAYPVRWNESDKRFLRIQAEKVEAE